MSLANWRSTHTFPLNTMQMLLRRIAKSVDKTALIAQRLKRVCPSSPSFVAFQR